MAGKRISLGMWSCCLIFLFFLAFWLRGAWGVAVSPPVGVYLNEQQLWFDQPPVLEGGRVLVPLRVIFEALGASVTYDPAAKKITAVRGQDQIILTVGSLSAFKNDALVKLDVPPRIVGGRTLVPLRFVSEALGCEVDWNGAARKVSIKAPGLGGPEPPVFKDPLADQYFERVVLSKLIMGAQGPAGVVPGSVFTPADNLNIDFTVRAAAPLSLELTRRVVGDETNRIIFEDSVTVNRPGGNGFSFPNPGTPGRYRFEVCCGGKLVLSLPFVIENRG
ncbi:MAG: copper amine oxidase N-terminal domain-containing protein [Bacillota bacterium]|nr:copper amine oxidase N-terminal domain-containing protein [Bacillota bacterium]